MFKYTAAVALLAASWLTCAQAQSPSGAMSSSSSGPSATPADNSKANKTDPSNAQATADAQKNGSGDLSITRQIRKSVIADKSLSTYGHNVKIVSLNGNVTLNGVVRSDAERSNIEMKAAAVAGADHVTDDLKVARAQ